METPTSYVEFIDNGSILYDVVDIQASTTFVNNVKEDASVSNEDIHVSYENTDSSYESLEVFQSDEEAFQEDIYSPNGETLLGSFVHRNKAVTHYFMEWLDETSPVITTYTSSALHTGYKWISFINLCWIVLYILEFVITVTLYRKKRKA